MDPLVYLLILQHELLDSELYLNCGLLLQLQIKATFGIEPSHQHCFGTEVADIFVRLGLSRPPQIFATVVTKVVVPKEITITHTFST